MVFLRTSLQSFFDRIKAWVHPAAFTLTATAHPVVEMLEVLRPISEPTEMSALSVVAILEWTVSNIGGVLVVCLFKIRRYAMHRRADDVEAVWCQRQCRSF